MKTIHQTRDLFNEGIRQLPTAKFLRSDSWVSFKSWIRPKRVFVWEVAYLELRNWVEAKVRKVAGGN